MIISLPYKDRKAKCDIDLLVDELGDTIIIRYGDLEFNGKRDAVVVDYERMPEFLEACRFLIEQAARHKLLRG